MKKKWIAVLAAMAVTAAAFAEYDPHLIVSGTTVNGYIKKVLLENLVIPNGILKIGNRSFEDCISLTSVTIPDTVEKIGESAFRDCILLTSVTIPSNVREIGDEAFYGCKSLASVTIADGVQVIGEDMFEDCISLTSVTIPGSVREIGESAFADCESLATVTIADGVQVIGSDAFAYCESLASVTIPGSVVEIGYMAFSGCAGFKVIYNGSLKDWCATDWDYTLLENAESIILADGTDLKKMTSIAANDLRGVREIGGEAFYGCISLASVTIPNTVKRIGYEAFKGCTGIEVIYNGSLKEWCAADWDPALLENAKSITLSDGTDLKKMTSIAVNDLRGVERIGYDAFRCCTSLASVTIPVGVTEIGVGAFEGCTSLTSVSVPRGMWVIRYNAFANCSPNLKIQYDGTKAQWNAIGESGGNKPKKATIHCSDGIITN